MLSGLMNALALGATYALIAVGHTLVCGIIKLINDERIVEYSLGKQTL